MYQDVIEQWLNKEKHEPTPTQTKLINWISQHHPSDFLTVQLPLNWRNGGLDKYNTKLKAVIKRFQKCLRPNHWNKKPLPMICIAEKNSWFGYHFHILIYDCKYTTEQLQGALDRTEYDLRLTHQTFELEPITFTPEHLFFYCVKQIKTEHDIKERISTTSTIFNIPEKKQQKWCAQSVKPQSKFIKWVKRFILKHLFIGCLWYQITTLPIRLNIANYQSNYLINSIAIT